MTDIQTHVNKLIEALEQSDGLTYGDVKYLIELYRHLEHINIVEMNEDTFL
jgi:hypothetical protein